MRRGETNTRKGDVHPVEPVGLSSFALAWVSQTGIGDPMLELFGGCPWSAETNSVRQADCLWEIGDGRPRTFLENVNKSQ